MNYKVEIYQPHVINEVCYIKEVYNIPLKVNKAEELNIKQQNFISGVIYDEKMRKSLVFEGR